MQDITSALDSKDGVFIGGIHLHHNFKPMTNSFISETMDQELALADMETLNGGTFGAGVLVGAMAATVLIGWIGAEKKSMPGSAKRLFGKKNNDTETETSGGDDSDTTETEDGYLPVPGGGDLGAHY